MEDLNKNICEQLALAKQFRRLKLRALKLSVIPMLVAGGVALAIHPDPTAVLVAFSVFVFSFVSMMSHVRRRRPKCPSCGFSWTPLASRACTWKCCPGCGLGISEDLPASSDFCGSAQAEPCDVTRDEVVD